MTIEVTGHIENWAYDKKQNVIVGNIYHDKQNRWEDGQLFMTSKLKPMSMQVSTPKQGVVISTENSTYLLGNKK